MTREIEKFIKGWLKRNGAKPDKEENQSETYMCYESSEYYFQYFLKANLADNTCYLISKKTGNAVLTMQFKTSTLPKIKYIHKIFKDKMDGKF